MGSLWAQLWVFKGLKGVPRYLIKHSRQIHVHAYLFLILTRNGHIFVLWPVAVQPNQFLRLSSSSSPHPPQFYSEMFFLFLLPCFFLLLSLPLAVNTVVKWWWFIFLLFSLTFWWLKPQTSLHTSFCKLFLPASIGESRPLFPIFLLRDKIDAMMAHKKEWDSRGQDLTRRLCISSISTGKLVT